MATSGSAVIGNPANRGRAIALTFDQFKYGWAKLIGSVSHAFDELAQPCSGLRG
jgi:hypothetical protein